MAMQIIWSCLKQKICSCRGEAFVFKCFALVDAIVGQAFQPAIMFRDKGVLKQQKK